MKIIEGFGACGATFRF